MKITIQDIVELKTGSSFALGPNETFAFIDGKVIVTRTETDVVSAPPLLETTSNTEATQSTTSHEEQEEEKEFHRKWQIRPGIHVLHPEKGMIPMLANEEKYFETQTSKKLSSIFESFYRNVHVAHKYKKLKRAYLLHSEPGMGKSALIRKLCREALQRDGVAIVLVDGEINFHLLSHIFMKEYAPSVKMIMLVIEDMGKRDYIANVNLYNASCLNFLDGNQSLFRVPTMIVCTTNFAKELGPQFTNRPGRFNRIIRVEPPTDEEIFELVEGFGAIQLTENQKNALRGKKLTPDHCVEAIVRHELEEISFEQAVHDLLLEREGLIS